MNKDKIVLWCDRIIMGSLFILAGAVTCSNAATEIAASIAITTWFLKKIIKREFKLVHSNLNLALFAFVLVNLLSIVNSGYKYESLEGFFGKILEYTLLYLVVVEAIKTKRQFRNIIGIILFVCALIGLDALFQKFFGFDLIRRRQFGGMLNASFGNPGHFGAWLVMVLPLCLSLFLFGNRGWRKIRIISGLLFVLLLNCLILTHSRGALIGFIGAVFLIGLLRSKTLLIITLGCVLILPFVLPNPWKKEVALLADIDSASIKERLTFWRKTAVMIKDRPFIGHGINTFNSNWPKYRVGEEALGGGMYYPHNCYLHIAAETGMIGLGIFIWMIVMLFRTMLDFLKNIKLKTDEDRFYQATGLGLLGGITACLIHSFADTNLYVLLLATFFWFLLGLVMNLATKNYKSEQP